MDCLEAELIPLEADSGRSEGIGSLHKYRPERG